jgi:hypothetical protein
MTFQPPTDQPPNNGRRVALIKSLETNNRFYALVEEDSGIRNADAVERIPDNLLVGIAYPCLEDGLNDFAVIRTTFETIDLFPEDDPIREEMMEIVNDARGNLLRRLAELHDKIHTGHAHFLGTDYTEFKDYSLAMVHKGYPRRNLDSMMKLNVFSSVAEAEGHADPAHLLFYFEFTHIDGARMPSLDPREFIVSLFEEVILSVKDNRNYSTKYLFDRNVFQKFIAVMFVNYATTDPMFYGINKRDYGVSADKDMDTTPLYIAIRKELTDIEEQHRAEGTLLAPRRSNGTDGVTTISQIVRTDSVSPTAPPPFIPPSEPDFASAIVFPEADSKRASSDPNQPGDTQHAGRVSFEQAATMLPAELVNTEVLLSPITSLCSAAHLLMRNEDPEVQRFARIVLSDASKLVNELKRLGIISEMVNDPGEVL